MEIVIFILFWIAGSFIILKICQSFGLTSFKEKPKPPKEHETFD